MRARAWLALVASALLGGCVLPSYQKVGSDAKNAQTPPADAGMPNQQQLPGASGACRSCVQDRCADAFAQCGAACAQLELPISPLTPAPDDMGDLLQCMQDNCDDSCEVTWGCVGRYRWPAVTEPYEISLRVVDIISSNPLPGIHIMACQNSDPVCAEGSGLAGQSVSDATGQTSIAVPTDFAGYFLLDGSGDYLPAAALWTQPAYTVPGTLTQRMITNTLAQGLASGVGATLRPDAAQLIFRAQNCLPMGYLGATPLHADADDVSVAFTPSAQDSSRVFYTGFGQAIDTSLTGTSSVGSSFGGAFNLLPQTVTVIAKHDGMEVARASIQLRAGTVGFVYLVPNAR